MKARIPAILLAVFCLPAQTIDVGMGAGSLDPVISQHFVSAFFRNGFSNLVTTPPVGLVRTFGGTGLIQEFNSSSGASGVRLALVKPNTSTVSVEGIPDVMQVRALLYDYYTSVGVGTAGFPSMDTATCPNSAAATCYWQTFTKNFALFSYTTSLPSGASNFTAKDPFYTEWLANGGISTFGAANSAETAVTSTTGSVATIQTYQGGAIVNITAGTLTGRLVSVRNPVYLVYVSNGGPTGFLGLPTGPEQIAGTKRRQSFEGGSIEYEPGQGAVLRLPVTNVTLSTSVTTLRLKLNESFSLTAIPTGAGGEPLLDRGVAWVTTNGRVVTIQANGQSATLKAVGGGLATITAVSEGKISAAITVSVQAPCCQIGEGAPSAAASQAISDAVVRNRLTLQLPGLSPVRRVASGYQQEFQTTSGNRVVIALPDRSAQAWLLTGSLLAAYTIANGAAGPLGYPVGDPTSGGRQLFEGGALAGTPVQLVTGGILSRWELLTFEAGLIGAPIGPATPFSTFAASTGVFQNFFGGMIVQSQIGSLAGRSVVVGGRILSLYRSLGATAGRFGAPVNEEFTLNGRRRQDFEGGYMEYTPGTEVVDTVESARKPTISVVPSAAVAGSRIRIAAGGFPDNSTLRVSATGQPDFLVRTTNGSYAWDSWIPADSTSRSVTIRAVATTAVAALAETTYAIRSSAESRPRLTKVQGDAQSGAPGTRLPIPLRVNLRDESGSPLVGATVTFAASPGAEVSPRSSVTDGNGNAESSMRLPSSSGIALVTAEASRQVVTFSAQSTGASVSNFPRLTFDGNSYVGSAAAILKYYQDRGELKPSAGTVTAAAIDSFLRNLCVVDAQANQICDGYLAGPEIPNLWRLINYAGGELEILPVDPAESSIREALAAGTPVLVSFRLSNGTPAAAVAAGVNADGGILLMDPSPLKPKASLGDFLGANATIAGAVRFVPRASVAGGFLVTVNAASSNVASPAGSCGRAFAIPSGDSATLFVYCDGTQALYQAEIAAVANYRGFLTDLAANGPRFEISGLRTGAFRIARPSLYWELSSLEASFQPSSVVNAASFTTDYAAGTAISIFGLGLARANGQTIVEVGGRLAQVIFTTPFQVNAVIPLSVPSGSSLLRLSSPYGNAEAQVDVRDAAPAVFRLSDTQAAVTNQDGTLNTPSNPAVRGQVVIVYGTGFGGVQDAPGTLRPTTHPVTVECAGVNLPVVYAGLTPGSIGLYQLNVQLPSDMPPGLFQAAQIRQAGVIANPLVIAIR